MPPAIKSRGVNAKGNRLRTATDLLISNVVYPGCWLVMGIFLLVQPVRGLDAKLAISQYTEDIWLKRDGLPTNAIKAIAQTADGYLWLGTTAGLVRFDGVRFSVIPTNSQEPSRRESITVLCPDKDNTLWVGVDRRGIRRIREGVASTLDIGNADPFILDLKVDHKGVLRSAAPLGLYQFDSDGRWQLATTKTAYVTGITEDARGRIWVSTHGDVEYLEGNQWTEVVSEPGAESILADHQGNIWVGASTRLLCCDKNGIHVYGAESGLLGNRITALCEDRDGNIWVGTIEGLNRVRRDPKTNAVSIDHTALKNISAIKEDREGNLWIGTEDGLHRFKNVNIIPWTTSEGIIGNSVTTVNGSVDGSIYIFSKGTPHGATQLKSGVTTQYTAIDDGPSYVARDGSLWVSSNKTLTQLKDQKIKRYSTADGVPEPWIAAITEDKESLILCLSTMSGICRWSPGGIRPYLLKDGSAFTVPYHISYALRQEDGTIWLGGFDGLWRLKDGDVTRFTTPKGMLSDQDWYQAHPQSQQYFHTVVSPGLSDDWVIAIADDGKGTLWIASPRAGLTRMKNGEFHSYTTRDGLISNQICSVLVDDLDDIWIGTPIGISRVSSKEFNDQANGQIPQVQTEVFNSGDGMKADECSSEYQPAAWKSKDGKLWFATHYGAVSVDPTQLRRNPEPPHVVIESFVIDENRQNTAPATMRIPPGGKKFEIRYTALSFINPDRIKFQYRLQGYDPSWAIGDEHRIAYYTRLPPGTYRFLVKACNSDGVWDPEPAELAFIVEPFFFQTIWFYFLCTVVAAGAIFGLHRLHVRRLYARENELQVRVDQRTGELSKSNEDLRKEVLERERAEQEVERVYKQLLTASHQAGMAEVAAEVLHNVGNVLNSVNVSTSMISDTLEASKATNLTRVVDMLTAHKSDLGHFLTADPKGVQLPVYLTGLASNLTDERTRLLSEVKGLRKNVEHIKDIVAMQQSYAGLSGLVETMDIVELIEEAVQMNDASFQRDSIRLVREFPGAPVRAQIERHKILQILVNLFQNARRACEDKGELEKEIRVKLEKKEKSILLSVIDNGIGIPPENLARIFTHGFTTKKDGHGFGLHSAVLAARSFGGDLRVESQGLGTGATFILEVPLQTATTPSFPIESVTVQTKRNVVASKAS